MGKSGQGSFPTKKSQKKQIDAIEESAFHQPSLLGFTGTKKTRGVVKIRTPKEPKVRKEYLKILQNWIDYRKIDDPVKKVAIYESNQKVIFEAHEFIKKSRFNILNMTHNDLTIMSHSILTGLPILALELMTNPNFDPSKGEYVKCLFDPAAKDLTVEQKHSIMRILQINGANMHGFNMFGYHQPPHNYLKNQNYSKEKTLPNLNLDSGIEVYSNQAGKCKCFYCIRHRGVGRDERCKGKTKYGARPLPVHFLKTSIGDEQNCISCNEKIKNNEPLFRGMGGCQCCLHVDCSLAFIDTTMKDLYNTNPLDRRTPTCPGCKKMAVPSFFSEMWEKLFDPQISMKDVLTNPSSLVWHFDKDTVKLYQDSIKRFEKLSLSVMNLNVCEVMFRAHPNLVHCIKTKECSGFWLVPPNEEIWRSCFQCRKEQMFHGQKFGEDGESYQMAQTLMKESSSYRPCTNCSKLIFRPSGCDNMYCTFCHHTFTWKDSRGKTAHL